jgi:hypothetical protein
MNKKSELGAEAPRDQMKREHGGVLVVAAQENDMIAGEAER